MAGDNYRYWKGGDGTYPNDWGTAANWCSDIGLTTSAAVPTSLSWVFIGPNANYPILTLGANRTIRALCVCTCISGFSLTDNYTLTVTDYDAVIMSWMNSPTVAFYGGTLKVGTNNSNASIIFANRATAGDWSGVRTTVLDASSSSSGSLVYLSANAIASYVTVTGHSTATLVALGYDGGHNTINAGANALLLSSSVASTTSIASGAVLAMPGSSNQGTIVGSTLPLGTFTNSGTLGALPLDVLQAGN